MNPTDLIVSLHALLEQSGAVSIPQAATLLGASEDEVYDALETLLFAYDDAGIRLELGERGCSFARLIDYDGSSLRMSLEQTDVLIDALRACGVGPDVPLARKLVAAKGMARSDAEGAELACAEPGENGELLQTLASAHGRPLVIGYQGGRDRAPRVRTVTPEAVISQDGHRYLHAWCHEAGAVRDFRLDRMASVRLAKADELEAAAAQSARPKAQQARVRFDAGAPLPDWPGARLTREDDGATLVTVKWLGGAWLPKQVAAQLGAAHVVEPQALKKAVREYAAQLLNA